MADFEAFLEDLDALMNTYRNARIEFIKLSQRKAGEPTPTVTTWQHALDRIIRAERAVQALIMNYRETVPEDHKLQTYVDGSKSGRTEHAESNVEDVARS